LCAGCQAPLAAGAVLCVSCGLNLHTGQKLQAPSRQKQQDEGERRPLFWGGVVAAGVLVVAGGIEMKPLSKV